MELVTHKWFASSLQLLEAAMGALTNHQFFHLFHGNRSYCQNTSEVVSLPSFVFSLSGMVGGNKRSVSDTASSPVSLCSIRPSSARWSTFPCECSQAIHLFLPLPPSRPLYCIALSPSPLRWLRVVVHLQAVCGMVLWAGIWQPLIREQWVSWCYSFFNFFIYLFFSFWTRGVVQGYHCFFCFF